MFIRQTFNNRILCKLKTQIKTNNDKMMTYYLSYLKSIFNAYNTKIISTIRCTIPN